MRTDHHAYQRATQVAGIGFMLQATLGLSLLLLGIIPAGQDTGLIFASVYVLVGVVVWLGLMIVFHQHKLERLEALEQDELAATRGDSASVFQQGGELRIAERRLRLMHQWLMPGLSLLLVAMLCVSGWFMLRHLGRVADLSERGTVLSLTELNNWALAVCLGIAALGFIFSRFIAGMAKQPAWQNLRGGASWMVGTALVAFALAVGYSIRSGFDSDYVLRGVIHAMPWFMFFLAAEIVLNFILNIYRPRIPGETPRPAFDSKVLSLFAAPDSIVRSLNEAVNYQFGFDITSSWGYQLLLRSFAWLLLFGAGVMVLLSTMVIIEPHQQAVRLRGGAIVAGPDGRERVYGSGIMWKLPWPLERAEIYDVSRVRRLPLTAAQVAARPLAYLWTDEAHVEGDLDPFMVRAPRQAPASADSPADEPPAGPATDTAAGDEKEERVANQWALVDAEIALQYRIRADAAGEGLRRFIRFGTEVRRSRNPLDARQQALRSLALAEITRSLAARTLDEVLSHSRAALSDELVGRVQAAMDRYETGVDIVAVTIPLLRPSWEAVQNYDEVDIARQVRLRTVAEREADAMRGMTMLVGGVDKGPPIVDAIDRWEALRKQHGETSPQALEQRAKVDRLINEAGGSIAFFLAEAARDRWLAEMEARGKLTRIMGDLDAYRAAPRLYRERRVMEAFADALLPMRKYIVAIDPAHLNLDMQFKELNPLLTTDFKAPEEGGSMP